MVIAQQVWLQISPINGTLWLLTTQRIVLEFFCYFFISTASSPESQLSKINLYLKNEFVYFVLFLKVCLFTPTGACKTKETKPRSCRVFPPDL